MNNHDHCTKERPSTVAIVVTYNRKERLSSCIQALLDQEVSKCNVIIWDNNSLDGTREYIDKFLKNDQITYIKSDNNIGCTGGILESIRIAYQRGYRNVWILDDDMVPTKTALHALEDAADNIAGWGCLSSTVYWTDGGICNSNRQKKGVFTFVKNDEYKTKSIIPVNMVSWGSMFLKMDAIREVGLPIRDYFIYTDDYELSHRISKEYKVCVVTQSAVNHYMPSNRKTDIATATDDRIGRYKYLFRNDVHLYRQFGLKGWGYILLKDVLAIFRIIACSKEKKKKLSIVINGFSDGLKFTPEIERLI